MSIAALVDTLLSAGLDRATIVEAVRAAEAVRAEAVDAVTIKRTARQERNSRYYQANKERLKASEKRLNQTGRLNSDASPSEVSEGFPTPLPNLPNSPSKNPPKGGQKGSPSQPSRFDEFWQAYPKRDGSNPKEPARLKFEQAVKRGDDPEAIISAAKRYAEQQKRLGNLNTPYVKQAVSWLNAKSWLDDYGSPSQGAANDEFGAARDMLARLDAAQIESYVRRYFAKQMVWNSKLFGPPPDRPNTLIPPEIIVKCRPKEGQAA